MKHWNLQTWYIIRIRKRVSVLQIYIRKLERPTEKLNSIVVYRHLAGKCVFVKWIYTCGASSSRMLPSMLFLYPWPKPFIPSRLARLRTRSIASRPNQSPRKWSTHRVVSPTVFWEANKGTNKVTYPCQDLQAEVRTKDGRSDGMASWKDYDDGKGWCRRRFQEWRSFVPSVTPRRTSSQSLAESLDKGKCDTYKAIVQRWR